MTGRMSRPFAARPSPCWTSLQAWVQKLVHVKSLGSALWRALGPQLHALRGGRMAQQAQRAVQGVRDAPDLQPQQQRTHQSLAPHPLHPLLSWPVPRPPQHVARPLCAAATTRARPSRPAWRVGGRPGQIVWGRSCWGSQFQTHHHRMFTLLAACGIVILADADLLEAIARIHLQGALVALTHL